MSSNQIINDNIFNLHKHVPVGTTFDLIIADPPYGNVISNNWDKFTDAEYQNFTEKWIAYLDQFTNPSTSIYIFCSIGEKSSSLPIIWTTLKEHYQFKDMVVWSKQRGRGNRRGWLFTREEILWGVKSKEFNWNKEHQYSTHKYDPSWIKRLKKENNPYKRATNVWTDIKERSIQLSVMAKEDRKNIHPTQKPVTLIERIINSHSFPGMNVLDAFSGSGTTSVACKLHSIDSVGVEMDKEYFTKIEQRLELSNKSDRI